MADRMNAYLAGTYSPAHLAYESSTGRPSSTRTKELQDSAFLHGRSKPARRPTMATVSSLGSFAQSDAASLESSSSTAASTSLPPSEHPNQAPYNLPCVFEYCQITFPNTARRLMIRHSLSHFGANPPPAQTMCSYCDTVFDEESNDPESNWRQKLAHEQYQHHRVPNQAKPRRPDFHLLEHLLACNLMTQDDFDQAMEYTERPEGCDGLVSRGFHSTKKKLEAQRRLQRQYQLEEKARFEKEERYRARKQRAQRQ